LEQEKSGNPGTKKTLTFGFLFFCFRWRTAAKEDSLLRTDWRQSLPARESKLQVARCDNKLTSSQEPNYLNKNLHEPADKFVGWLGTRLTNLFCKI
jgi:hypothetical protein